MYDVFAFMSCGFIFVILFGTLFCGDDETYDDEPTTMSILFSIKYTYYKTRYAMKGGKMSIKIKGQ